MLTLFKAVQVPFEVGASGLRSSSDGHGATIKEISRRASLVDVRPSRLRGGRGGVKV